MLEQNKVQDQAEAGVRYWLAMASLNDVHAFRQERKVRLRKLGVNRAFATRPGDRIVLFSSSSPMGILQAFSGVGILRTTFSQVRTQHGLHYEAEVDFLESQLVKMKFVVRSLSFIQDASLWSRDMPQVMDLIGKKDFDLLMHAMAAAQPQAQEGRSAQGEAMTGDALRRVMPQSGTSTLISTGRVGEDVSTPAESLRSQSRSSAAAWVGAAAS